MEKKKISMLLITSMLLALTSCGKNTTPEVIQDTVASTEEIQDVTESTESSISEEEKVQQTNITEETFQQLPEVSKLCKGELKSGRNPDWVDNRTEDEYSLDFFYKTYDSADALQQDYPYYILKLNEAEMNDTIKFDSGVIDNDIAKVCYTDDSYSFYMEIITNPTMDVTGWYSDLEEPQILRGRNDIELYYAESEDGYIKRGSFRIGNMIYTINTMGMTQESMLYYVASLFV